MPARPLPADDGPPIDLVRARLARIAEESGLTGLPGLTGLSPADDHTRVRAERWRAEVLARAGDADASGGRADELPVPGRHARRTARAGVLGRVRGQLPPPALALLDRASVPSRPPVDLPYAAAPAPAGSGGGDGSRPGRRVTIGPPQVAVLAVLVALALAATCWWVLAGRAEEQVVEPLAVATSAAGTPLATPSSASAAGAEDGGSGADGASGSAGETQGDDEGEVVVHVAGRVARPGIVVLPGGARVADAVEAAGGTVPDTDLTGLNLARVLVDGEQVLVGLDPSEGAPTAPTAPGAAAPGGAAPSQGGLVDLNTADLAALDLLPGVGPVTAQAIIDWREENGGFSHVDELLEVKGIGEATLAELAPLVTV
ncbi:competence protein ComEA [Nocardioides zeae]|uniref:Competence protein ComEA n=1 Tax=Nocardioides zeae TaxID=1457234 RepID=A0ACC6IGW5_9ACTN|nr:ComEA family DNA-binding protein [Nocardioides zeae]MDR6172852.1 competence protein ComEA [Nocardioides zeae]MDR6209862.1 competence protein ComEA [Nocardioides zeae]